MSGFAFGLADTLPAASIISKPFRMAELRHKVAAALGGQVLSPELPGAHIGFPTAPGQNAATGPSESRQELR